MDKTNWWRDADSLEYLKDIIPNAYEQLQRIIDCINSKNVELQDITFIVEKDTLYVTKKNSKLRFMADTANVIKRIDDVEAGYLSEGEALEELDKFSLEQAVAYFKAPVINESFKTEAIAKGAPVIAGVVTGPVHISSYPDPLGGAILVSLACGTEGEASEDHRKYSEAANSGIGFLSRVGYSEDHLAYAMREESIIKPRICGFKDMTFEAGYTSAYFDLKRINKISNGDVITIDGTSGLVFIGELPSDAFRDSEVVQVLNGELEPEAAYWYPYYLKVIEWLKKKGVAVEDIEGESGGESCAPLAYYDETGGLVLPEGAPGLIDEDELSDREYSALCYRMQHFLQVIIIAERLCRDLELDYVVDFIKEINEFINDGSIDKYKRFQKFREYLKEVNNIFERLYEDLESRKWQSEETEAINHTLLVLAQIEMHIHLFLRGYHESPKYGLGYVRIPRPFKPYSYLSMLIEINSSLNENVRVDESLKDISVICDVNSFFKIASFIEAFCEKVIEATGNEDLELVITKPDFRGNSIMIRFSDDIDLSDIAEEIDEPGRASHVSMISGSKGVNLDLLKLILKEYDSEVECLTEMREDEKRHCLTIEFADEDWEEDRGYGYAVIKIEKSIYTFDEVPNIAQKVQIT